MSLNSKIESILFVSPKAVSLEKLKSLTGASGEDVRGALEALRQKYAEQEGGLHILEIGNSVQLATIPENAEVVSEFMQQEQTGELSRPALETLAIVAYRGPVTRAEVEQIRGVNSSIILRNLMVRGLVEAEEDAEQLTTTYRITFDFLKSLGISKPEELPEYAGLNNNVHLQDLLAKLQAQAPVTQ